jgi:coronin-1B/1C/6
MSLSGRKGVSFSDSPVGPSLIIPSDGNIRYYEFENDKFEYLSEYSSANPQRGVAFLPKRGVNMHENEVTRAFKTVNDTYIEPISFVVPRRAEVFQSDVYPPTTGLKPAMSFADWLGGKDGLPPKIDMESLYEGQEPVEVPSDYKPTPTLTPAPEPVKKEPEPKAEPAPTTALRGPPPSMKEQTASIAAMTSKYADKDEVESPVEEESSSSFEEVPKPVERAAVRPASPVKGPPAAAAAPAGVPERKVNTFPPYFHRYFN